MDFFDKIIRAAHISYKCKCNSLWARYTMDKIYANVGKRISELRIEHGLTQEKLAERVNSTAEHVNKVERNKKRPSLTFLKKMADAFDLPLYAIFLNEQEKDVADLIYSVNELLHSKPKKNVSVVLRNLRKIIRAVDEIAALSDYPSHEGKERDCSVVLKVAENITTSYAIPPKRRTKRS